VSPQHRARQCRSANASNSLITFLSLVVLALLLIGFGGCKNFLIEDVLDGKNATPLELSPTAVSLLVGGEQQFIAAGGVPPYTFSVASGSGSMVGSTYHAPASATTAVVRVSDAAGASRDATVKVYAYGDLGITPSSITMGVEDTVTFSAIGGDPPYTYTVEVGGGSIICTSGAYGEYGEYEAPLSPDTVTVRVTDSASSFAEATVSVEAAVALGISPTDATVELGDTLQFSAYGGAGGYTYTVAAGAGDITGGGLFTATDVNTVTVQVEDGVGSTATTDVSVVAQPLVLSPAAVTLEVGGTMTFSATGGQGSYTYSITSGLGDIDTASGLFTATDPGSVTVQVEDDALTTDTAAVTVNEAPPGTLTISPGSISLEVGNTVTFSATGGDGGYSYSIASGPGNIDSGTGEFAATDTGTAVVQVEDGSANTDTANVTITAPALVISPSSISLEVGESVTLTATGGVGGNSFAIVSGPGNVDSGTGEYTATDAGTATVEVTDSGTGSDTATVVVSDPPLTLSPSSISIEIGDQVQFTADGGDGSYSYGVVPPSLGSINASGLFTALASGAATVTVTDGASSSQTATVNISAPPLLISPSSVTLYVGQSVTFSATGGEGAYTYSITVGLGNIGSASGVFTATDANTVTVQVEDGKGATKDATVQVTAVPTAQVDYEIQAPSFPGAGSTNEPTLTGTFDIKNVGTDGGSVAGTWYVYLSADAAVSPGDSVVDSGPFGPMNPPEPAVTQPFSGTWPDLYGTYHLIIHLEAEDDTTSGNDTLDSGAILVKIGTTGTAHELEPNGDWNPDTDWGWTWMADANDFGITLEPGSCVVIKGHMENDRADIFAFNAGATTTIRASLIWGGPNSDDAMDLVVWPAGGPEIDGPYLGDGYDLVGPFDTDPPGAKNYTNGPLYITVGNDFGGGWNPNQSNNRAYTMTIYGD